MGLRVNTNVASINAQRNLSGVSQRLGGNFARLSSGLRIANAADDAAGLGISERMRSQIRSYAVASRNTQDGISLVQTAEGALNEVSNILGRMRELAVQASNGTLTEEDRTTINTEFAQLLEEVDRIATTANFNGLTLFNGDNDEVGIQVGINGEDADLITIELQEVTADGLGIDSLDVSETDDARSALETIDAAINSVNTARGDLGASQNRLFSSLANTQIMLENLSAAESRIRDVDVAFETADLTRNSIMQQAATAVLAQANAQPQLALSLLG